MSETTGSPRPDDEPGQESGTFVGGAFGSSREDEQTTTAEQVEGEQEQPSAAPDGPQAPASTQEFAAPPATEQFPSDVEGTSTEPAPGDRNEPV